MSHETLSDALDCAENDLEQVVLDGDFREDFAYGGIPYGTSKSSHTKIVSIKGKPTKKYFHVNIYRLDSGRYELVSYIS